MAHRDTHTRLYLFGVLLTFISSLAGLVSPGTQGRSTEGKETIKESSIVVKNADSGLKYLG